MMSSHKIIFYVCCTKIIKIMFRNIFRTPASLSISGRLQFIQIALSELWTVWTRTHNQFPLIIGSSLLIK